MADDLGFDFDTSGVQRQVENFSRTLSQLQETVVKLNATDVTKIKSQIEALAASESRAARESATNAGKVVSALDEVLAAKNRLESGGPAAAGLFTDTLEKAKTELGELVALVKVRLAEVKILAQSSASNLLNNAGKTAVDEAKASKSAYSVLGANGEAGATKNANSMFAQMLYPRKEAFLAAEVEAEENALAFTRRVYAKVRAATLAAVGDLSSISSGALNHVRNAELLMNMPPKEAFLAAEAEAVALAEASTARAYAKVRAATLAAVGDFSSVSSGRLNHIHNAELMMSMPPNSVFEAAAAEKALVATAAVKKAYAQVRAATIGAEGAYSNVSTGRLVTPKIDPVPENVIGSFKSLEAQGRNAHSAIRGLASGFNAMWLTYGNVAPLMAGAALSTAAVQTVKIGAEVESSMAILQTLGGATSKDMRLLNDELERMGRSGPVGPVEVANAMKELSLAGLKANDILAVTQTVMNFSVSGTTSIKTAADTLMTVSTAFGMGSAGFSTVADVITKAASESKTSVETFSNAMKTASVINAQYGVSLKDTAIAIAAMSQLGIEGTAAGTALRNMYADMSGRSKQVAKVLKEQGIEMRDATGAFRPMIQVVGELNDKLMTKTGIAQKDMLSAILSERGAKGVIELLRLVNTSADATGKSVQTMFDTLSQSIDKSAGTSAVAAAKLSQTVESQFKAVKATMQTTMVEVYQIVQPKLLLIADQMKKSLASDEFKASLSNMVGAIVQIGSTLVQVTGFLINHAAAVALVTGAYYLTKTAVSMLAAAEAKRTAEAIAGSAAVAAAEAAANASKLGGLARLASFLPGVGTAIGLITAGWIAYDFWRNKARDSDAEAAALYTSNVVQTLTDQAVKLERINTLRAKGLSLTQAQNQANVEEKLKKDTESVTGTSKSATTDLDNAKAKLNSLQVKPESRRTRQDKDEIEDQKQLVVIATNRYNLAKQEENRQIAAIESAALRFKRAQEKIDQGLAKEIQERKDSLDALSGTEGFAKPDTAKQGKSELEKAQDKAKALTKTAAEYAAAANAETESVNALTEVEKKRVKTMTDVALLRAEYLSSSPAVQAAIRKETDKAMELANAALEDDKVRQARDSRVKSAKEMAEILEKARSSSRAFWEKDTNAQAKTAEANALNLALVNMTEAQKASATAINEANAQFATGMEPLTKLLEEAQSKLDTLYSTAAKKDVGQSGTPNFDAASQEALIIQAIIERLRIEINAYKELAAAKAAARGNAAEAAVIREDLQKSTVDFAAGAKNALTDYLNTTKDVAGDTKNAFKKAFSGMEDAIVNFTKTGKFSVSDMATSIISDLIRIQIQQSITRPLGNALGSFMSSFFGPTTNLGVSGSYANPGLNDSAMLMIPSAKGNVFQSPGLSAYSGQIVNTPTTFAFAKGGGLMGEAGPEAIMPLTRGANGKLGVQSTGGSSNVQVIVNNNSTNTQIDKKESTDSRGNRSVELTISDMVAGEVRRSGSSVHNAVRGTFGASPKLVGR